MSFKLTVPIEECYIKKSFDEQGNAVDKRYITGIASGTELDKDTEKMAESALFAMRQAIDDGILTEKGEPMQVPLYNEHRKETLEQLGWLTKAWLEKRNDEIQLWIEAELDDDNPRALQLYKKLTTPGPKNRPVQLGLSISGKVVKAYRQFDPSIKKAVTVFEQIALGEVSVVTKPAYAGSYLDILEKSYKEETGNDLPFHGEYSMDMTKTEAQTLETPSDTTEKNSVTEPQDSTATDTTEKATTDNSQTINVDYSDVEKALQPKFDDLANQIKTLVQLVEQMKGVLRPEQGEEIVPKSEKEVEDDSAITKDEKTIDDSAIHVFKQAFSESFASAVSPLVDKIQSLETSIADLGKPVDKSFSVLGQDGAPNKLAEYEILKSEAQKAGKPFDPLAVAVKLAYGKQQ